MVEWMSEQFESNNLLDSSTEPNTSKAVINGLNCDLCFRKLCLLLQGLNIAVQNFTIRLSLQILNSEYSYGVEERFPQTDRFPKD